LGDLGIDDFLNTECENMDGIHLAQDRNKWLALVNRVAELHKKVLLHEISIYEGYQYKISFKIRYLDLWFQPLFV
jgi:hypothetical protein